MLVTRPHSKFANPYRIGHEARDAAEAVAMFRLYLLARPDLVAAAQAELRGKTLACWCPLDAPCHADVLLGVIDAIEEGGRSGVPEYWARLPRRDDDAILGSVIGLSEQERREVISLLEAGPYSTKCPTMSSSPP